MFLSKVFLNEIGRFTFVYVCLNQRNINDSNDDDKSNIINNKNCNKNNDNSNENNTTISRVDTCFYKNIL